MNIRIDLNLSEEISKNIVDTANAFVDTYWDEYDKSLVVPLNTVEDVFMIKEIDPYTVVRILTEAGVFEQIEPADFRISS